MLRIGLLGASRISVGAVIEPARVNQGAAVTGVAARDPSRARNFAVQHGIPRVFEDYDALITSSDIDIVYNGLPPSSHKPWAVAALRAGKAVLCEKPFAMNVDEAREMVDAATETGNCLIEAFHYRFHPFFLRILDIVQSGELGTIERANAHFNVPIRFSSTELRYQPELGGGALMDLGVYPLHWLRTLFGAEPQVTDATSVIHGTGVDLSTSGTLEFPDGSRASFSTSMDETLPDRLDTGIELIGSKGTLVAENPLAPHIGNQLRWTGAREPWSFEGHPTYYYQLGHVLSVLQGEQPQVTGGRDAVATMHLVDAVKRTALNN